MSRIALDEPSAAIVLPEAFFGRDTVDVARALLGRRLVRVLAGRRLSGLINETEAYRGADDQASHAYRRTPRSGIMFGPPGRAYVYFIYGRNYCLNTVTEADGEPGAVLIRGILPVEGEDLMQAFRGFTGRRGLTDGPGKLCQALKIDLALNGVSLVTRGSLFIEDGYEPAPDEIRATPRIGVRGDAETRSRPWRFLWQPARGPGLP